VPEDFIVTQSEQSKLVATEDTLNTAIMKKAPAAVIQSLTTISCGLKLKQGQPVGDPRVRRRADRCARVRRGRRAGARTARRST
jgi:hypothetical protein